ncbi:MAG: hypothetical protein WAW17_14565 [Rhodococcus sp. (in: high G+C Gram-positive bacteria)]|uniref:hypothetical protein n=1 Tax=Rhodococcus sp. TaxID=1831 RepID=UPI003BAE8005
MTHRSASRIHDVDSAVDAEYKSAMAQSAVCQIHIEHFTRVIALIDHAEACNALDDLMGLYPLAFATVSTITSTTLTPDSARCLARTIIDEMGLAVHELDWEHRSPVPATPDEELLRKSHAVVCEDDALKRLTRVRNQLRTFEEALSDRPWASSFLQPHPFSRTEGDRSEYR